MRKRRVRLNNDIPLLQPLHDIRMIQPRVQLILTDINLTTPTTLDVSLQFFEMVDAVIGYTDGFHFSCFLGFD
jgi:hypothetical protein